LDLYLSANILVIGFQIERVIGFDQNVHMVHILHNYDLHTHHVVKTSFLP